MQNLKDLNLVFVMHNRNNNKYYFGKGVCHVKRDKKEAEIKEGFFGEGFFQ